MHTYIVLRIEFDTIVARYCLSTSLRGISYDLLYNYYIDTHK